MIPDCTAQGLTALYTVCKRKIKHAPHNIAALILISAIFCYILANLRAKRRASSSTALIASSGARLTKQKPLFLG
jgi:hypothetical protein